MNPTNLETFEFCLENNEIKDGLDTITNGLNEMPNLKKLVINLHRN